MVRRSILIAVAVVILATSSLIGVVLGGSASAAQTSRVGGNSLKVSPVRQDISMDPGTKKTVTVYIQNLTSVQTTLHAAMNDFVAAGDESGKPSIILDEDQYAPSHSLKRFMTPIKDFTIKANETKQIDLVVSVPKSAAGGGYFGAIRFEPAGQSDGDENLNLSASVGSLVLLKVNGDIKEQLAVESFEVKQKGKSGKFFTSNKDLQAVARFKNDGNVHVSPFGKVVVKKSGEELSSQEINTSKPLASVLPDSIRKFEVSMGKVGSFGKYTVEGNFGYGSTGQLITAKTTFYVVPVVVLIAIGLGIILLLAAIFILPRTIRSYNRRVIRKASRRR
jgi:hypothetical protein